MLKIKVTISKAKPVLAKYLALGFLHLGKPFSAVSQWCWHMNKKFLDMSRNK